MVKHLPYKNKELNLVPTRENVWMRKTRVLRLYKRSFNSLIKNTKYKVGEETTGSFHWMLCGGETRALRINVSLNHRNKATKKCHCIPVRKAKFFQNQKWIIHVSFVRMETTATTSLETSLKETLKKYWPCSNHVIEPSHNTKNPAPPFHDKIHFIPF